MLLLLRDTGHLRDLGFGDLETEYPADSFPFRMYLKHHACSLTPLHSENGFKNFDNEFHRRVVVIDQHYPIQWRPLELGFRFFYCEIEVVDTCRDVESALAAVTVSEIDVGILDINLGDGTTCEPVASRLLDSETPFFFVTGYGSADLLPDRFSHIECLSKPVMGSDVANMVHKLAEVG